MGGKIVGKPTFFGLEDRDDIPKKLLQRIVGEVEADSLEADVTADWGSMIENSIAYQEAREWVEKVVHEIADEQFSREINLTKARHQKVINDRLALLPEYRRDFVQKKIDQILKKFYGDSEEKIFTVISFLLDALEKDEYWKVCNELELAKNSDVMRIAEALEEFGIVDMAVMVSQAHKRLRFLDALDEMITRDETLEKEIHKAIENNLWILGTEFSLMSSNKTLAKTIEEYTDEEFKGERANKRPDLLLSQDVSRDYLLIEFKRPSKTINRDDESQARKYRDDLSPRFGKMKILVIGGTVDLNMDRRYDGSDIELLGYSAIISNARKQLEWLVNELHK